MNELFLGIVNRHEKTRFSTDKPFKNWELLEPIRQLKTKKAPGDVNISCEVDMNAGKKFLHFMLKIFNISFEIGIIQKEWKRIIVKNFTKRKETEDC